MNTRIAVVTGGSAGLGRAVVREFAARGWDVAVLARGADGLAGAVADVEAAGRRALAVPVDVADRFAVDAAADRVEAELGPIDVWVNNAMTGILGEFEEVDPADFERAFHVDFFGFVNGTRGALRVMGPRGRGGVIQVGSALAHRGIPLQSAYCAAKHAITGFTESVRAELEHHHSPITLSQVDMPAMNTPQFGWVRSLMPDHPQPVAPIYQPEPCARVVVDVAERPRRRTWVGESTVATIVGNRVAGRLADRYLARTGYSGQQAPDKTGAHPLVGPNLREPVAGDRGARGVFDDSALSGSPQIWAIRNRTLVRRVAGGVLGVAAVGVAAMLGRRSR